MVFTYSQTCSNVTSVNYRTLPPAPKETLYALSLPCPHIPTSPKNHYLFVSIDLSVLIFYINTIIYYVLFCYCASIT